MSASNIQIIKKNGKNEYVVMPYEEFLRVQEELDDYQNIRCLREAKESEQLAPTVNMDDLKKQLKKPAKSLRKHVNPKTIEKPD